MGSGGKKTTTNVQRNYPEWMDTALADLYNQGKAVSQKPYNPYPGSTVPPLTNMQDSALARLYYGADKLQPELTAQNSKLKGLADQGFERVGTRANPQAIHTNRFDQYDTSGYMNKYLQNALNPAIRDINENADLLQNKLSGLAASRGAFGGSRQALLESGLDKNRLQNISDLTYKAQSDAFNNAMGQFNNDENRIFNAQSKQADIYNNDIARELQAALANQSTDMANKTRQQSVLNDVIGNIHKQNEMSKQDTFDLLKGGAIQEAKQQALLNEQKQKYDEANNYQRDQLEFLSKLLHGFPSTQSTSTSTAPGQNNTLQNVSGAIGAAQGLASLASMFSDLRLKENIVKVDEKDGINIYEYSYIDEPDARYRGVMAQEVEHIPGAVIETEEGKVVNYHKLDIPFERVK